MTHHINNKPNIIIIGASGHAKVVIDIVEKQGLYTIYGLIDSYKEAGTKIYDYEVLGTEQLIPGLIQSKQVTGGIIAIGDNWHRQQMEKKISGICNGFDYVCAIHPDAILGRHVVVKEGTVIVGGAVINNDAVIERHCIVNTKVSIGHDCHLKEFSSVASGATLGGGAVVEKDSAISLGAVILGNVTIGENTVIGAGAVVTKNIAANLVAFGVPAKPVRTRKAGERYL